MKLRQLLVPSFSIVPLQVLFPASLTARQRAILHEIAEEHGFAHNSDDVEGQRQISICSKTRSSDTTKARLQQFCCHVSFAGGACTVQVF